MQVYTSYLQNLWQKLYNIPSQLLKNLKLLPKPWWKNKYIISSLVLGISSILCLRKLAQGQWFYSKTISSSTPKMNAIVNKTILITNGTSGIGLASAIEHYKLGANVYITCTDIQQGIKAVEYISNQCSSNSSVYYSILNMNDFSSIETFAQKFNSSGMDLDFLVLNPSPKKRNVYQLPTNTRKIQHSLSSSMVNDASVDVHGHAISSYILLYSNFVSFRYLTQLLLPAMKATADKRWTANANKYGPCVRIVRVNGDCCGRRMESMLDLITVESLEKQLMIEEYNQMIGCFCMYPGLVRNHVYQNLRWYQMPFYFMCYPLFYFIGRGVVAGSQTIVHLVCNSDVVGGGFYANCKLKKFGGCCVDECGERMGWMRNTWSLSGQIIRDLKDNTIE